MKRWQRWGLATIATWILVAADGVFTADVPGDAVTLLMLPALYLRSRRERLAALALLLLLEVLLDRTLLLAALSLLVTIEMIVSLMHDDFNLATPVFAVLALPAIELVRHFWSAIFAANYDIAAPPSLSVARLMVLAAGGLMTHLLLTLRGGATVGVERPRHWSS